MDPKHTNNRYTIKPQRAEIIFLTVCICIVFFLFCNGINPNLPWNRVSILHILILTGLLISVCRYYVIDPHGMSVNILNIPIRKYAWNQIADVILVRKRINGPAGNTEGVLLMIPRNCAPFRIGQDKVDMYIARHPFSVYSLNVSPKNADEYVEAFQKYRGKITIIEAHK